jgi:hypothetical protein
VIILWSSQCVAVVMKVLITQARVISFLGSIVEVGRNFKEVNSCNDLGSPHSSVTRSQFRTFNFLIMNLTKFVQKLKRFYNIILDLVPGQNLEYLD